MPRQHFASDDEGAVEDSDVSAERVRVHSSTIHTAHSHPEVEDDDGLGGAADESSEPSPAAVDTGGTFNPAALGEGSDSNPRTADESSDFTPARGVDVLTVDGLIKVYRASFKDRWRSHLRNGLPSPPAAAPFLTRWVSYFRNGGKAAMLVVRSYLGFSPTMLTQASLSTFIIDVIEWDCSFIDLPNNNIDDEQTAGRWGG